MEQLFAYSTLVGSLLPLVISFVKKSAWSTQQKRAASVVVALVAAVITTAATTGWGIEPLLASAGAIFALSKTTYEGFWEGTSADATLTKVMS
jgi:hypothetical protein